MLLDHFFDLFLLHFHDNVFAGLLVTDQDLGPHVHLELLFRDVVYRVPQLRIRFLFLRTGILKVNRAFRRQLIEQLRSLLGYLTNLISFSFLHRLVCLELYNLALDSPSLEAVSRFKPGLDKHPFAQVLLLGLAHTLMLNIT